MRHRRYQHPCFVALACALLLAGASRSAWGTTFPYGDFHDPLSSVTFFNVQETPTKIPAPSGFPYPLFGPPSVFGDNLEFSPGDFNATSTGGSLPFTDSHLSMTIVSMNDKSIDSILIKEGGSYSLIGGGVNTQAIISLNVVLAKILEVNNTPLVTPIDVPATVTYTNLGVAASTLVAGEMILNNSIGSPPPIAQGWQASAFFDFAAALALAQIEGPITTVKLTLDNALSATSELYGPNNNIASTAFIDKKDFSIQVDPVPEPASLVLILVGIMGTASMTYWRRRGSGSDDRSMANWSARATASGGHFRLHYGVLAAGRGE